MAIDWRRVVRATLINFAVFFGLVFTPLDFLPRMVAMLSLNPWSWVFLLLVFLFAPLGAYLAVLVSYPRSKWKSEFVATTGMFVGMIAGSKLGVLTVGPL